MDRPSSYPDGLTEAVIEQLIVQAYDAATHAPRPTSALLDGSAAERRRRRSERRAVTAVLRELSLCPAAGPDGREAA